MNEIWFDRCGRVVMGCMKALDKGRPLRRDSSILSLVVINVHAFAIRSIPKEETKI